MSHKDFTEAEPEGTESLSPASKDLFLEKVRQSNAACQGGDYATAVALYTDALSLDPSNHILYSNRSAALLKMSHFAEALRDAVRARELNPEWPKAYFREGVALQCLGKHADALAAFSSGLAVDPNSTQLLSGLLEAATKSPLRERLECIFRQLESMSMNNCAFVVISVVGQELLAGGHYNAAVTVLESALRIGTCSLKLRGSVFSALSSAYWALNSIDKAIGYMRQDLSVAKSLGDISGECRAHGNLGSAYFSKASYKEALTSHRHQLVLSMKCGDLQSAASALTSLGHVYTATGDYANALASHKQCVQLFKQLNDRLQEAREIGNVGAVYLVMGQFENAIDCHNQHLSLARKLANKVEEARACSNLGSSYHYRRNFTRAISYHEQVLKIALELEDKAIEARAYAGLGHAYRCAGHYNQAKKWHEKQLDTALTLRDRLGEGRACSNMGIVYQLMGEHDAALKLHQAHLNIARGMQDKAGMGRAYGNIGNAYSAMACYEQAIKYHKQELNISKEVKDRASEACTHGNLAVAYQALNAYEMALTHYQEHLNIARELKDTAGEACALLNLANCLSSSNEFSSAIPYYECYLMLSQELHDVEGEAKACHFLGYAHYCIGNYKEAVRYYDQDLALAKDLRDNATMARAYCNLGLAHLALGNTDTAMECQKYFLAIAHSTKHLIGKFRALGNIGDIMTKMGNVEEAVAMYQRQLLLARQNGDKSLEATAYASLGSANRLLQRYDKALGYHTQELTVRQEMMDTKGECRAHGNLGAIHMTLGNYTNAIKCYHEQLQRSKELADNSIEAQAFGNLGIAKLNMGHLEDAIGYFEQQLATLEQLSNPTSLLDKGRAFGNLGDCYDALGDWEEAVKCHENYLAIATKLKSSADLIRAYRGIGLSYKQVGMLQQALVSFEKQLVVAHQVDSVEIKVAAYGQLGLIHTALANYQQAISCLERQLTSAREAKDNVGESDASSGLGQVYYQMAEYTTALQYHQTDLEMAKRIMSPSLQCRAYGNLGSVHEALGNLQDAMRFQEEHLSIATEIDDRNAKTTAYSSLGRLHHALGNTSQAVAYLTQGLQICEVIGKREEEAKIRHRLGLALWSSGQLEAAYGHLDQAATLLEAIRNESTGSTDYKLSLFDLQTATYQALQRVLIGLNRTDDALLVAERGRTRAFVDLLLERQAYFDGSSVLQSEAKSSITSLSQILEIVNRQQASILYYSLAEGYLYAWFIVPFKGIVRFHQVALREQTVENGKNEENMGPCLLENYVQDVRDSFGFESSPADSDETNEVWSQHLDDLGDRLNQDGERASFLRMVNRNHLYNCSNYSLSSLFSVGSLGGSVASANMSRHGSVKTNASRTPWQGPACLTSLYQMLIAPFEDCLPSSGASRRQDLIFMLEGDLYLVPFPVLRPTSTSEMAAEYLSERFSLLVVPSFAALRSNQKLQCKLTSDGKNMTSLVIGNPKLPLPISNQYGWIDIPHATQEANMVAEMLQTKSLIGKKATKESVIREISQAECVHLATHVSWKLSAIVLSSSDISNGEQDIPLSEFLLTASELLTMKLTARLVVVSWSHSRDGCATADGVVGLSRALLAAGAQCVLVSLWPVPNTAAKILLKAFYSALLQGSRVSRALAEAVGTVQHTKHFAHPANWSGFLLVGADIRLSNKVSLMGRGLLELMKTPEKCRDALRVTLHLVEKSLQRINRGQKNAMYTTQKSIENKVGNVNGWKELLQSVGFRFEPAANGIPSSVFFPQSDPDERLLNCSASLQALLGVTSTTLAALSKLTANLACGEELMSTIRQACALMEGTGTVLESGCDNVNVTVSAKLWQITGCHELLASLGFDLMEVCANHVTLRMGAHAQANKRSIQFALQALQALYSYDSPLLQKGDSMESVNSTESYSSDREEEPVAEAEGECEPPVPSLTISRPMGMVTPLLRTGGAFTTYVKPRGEPDGKMSDTAPITRANGSSTCDLNYARKSFNSIKKGRESDVAFTPSPPTISSHQQIKSKTIYPYTAAMSSNVDENAARCSKLSVKNASKFWEDKWSLGKRESQQLNKFSPIKNQSSHDDQITTKIDATASSLGKLSIRANSQRKTDKQRSLYLLKEVAETELSVEEELEPSSMTTNVSSDMQDRIRISQLNREAPPTISDVYHERNIGLGLAPPLLKLLMPANEDQDDRNDAEWLAHALTNCRPGDEGFPRRDDGDGTSIAESQYGITGKSNSSPGKLGDSFKMDEEAYPLPPIPQSRRPPLPSKEKS